MHQLDSTQDKSSFSRKEVDSNLIVSSNQKAIVEKEDNNNSIKGSETEDNGLTPTKPIVEISKKEIELKRLNEEKDSILAGDLQITEIVEVIKPKKSLFFKGKEISKGESVNLAVQFAPNSHILVKNSELITLVSFHARTPKCDY